MWSQWLIYAPLALNAVMTVASLVDRDFAKVLYWGGATTLTVGVMFMGAK